MEIQCFRKEFSRKRNQGEPNGSGQGGTADGDTSGREFLAKRFEVATSRCELDQRLQPVVIIDRFELDCGLLSLRTKTCNQKVDDRATPGLACSVARPLGLELLKHG